MCLYPKLIKNKRYCSTKKNGGIIPECPDERLKYVTAACGKCYECRKQKARAWQVRMSEETRQNPNALFVTLTIQQILADRETVKNNPNALAARTRKEARTIGRIVAIR